MEKIKKYKLVSSGGGYSGIVSFKARSKEEVKTQKGDVGTPIEDHEKRHFDESYSRFKTYASAVDSYDGTKFSKCDCDCGKEYSDYNEKEYQVFKTGSIYDVLLYHQSSYLEKPPSDKKVDRALDEFNKAKTGAKTSKQSLDKCIANCQ